MRWSRLNSIDIYDSIRCQINTMDPLDGNLVTFKGVLGPSDTIWRQRSGSTSVQVMACYLTAPSHYLNRCWLIISKALWHSSDAIIVRRSEDTNQQNKIENYIFRITFRFPRGEWVNKIYEGSHGCRVAVGVFNMIFRVFGLLLILAVVMEICSNVYLIWWKRKCLLLMCSCSWHPNLNFCSSDFIKCNYSPISDIDRSLLHIQM